MIKKISLTTIFIGLFSQMLFLGEQNVIYANILSLPVVPAFILSVYKNTGRPYINFHSKALILLFLFFLLSYFWSDNQGLLDLFSYKALFLTIIFVVCISNIMKVHSSITPVMMAFWAISVFNFFILLRIIPQNLFFQLEPWEIRFWGTFNNPNLGAISFVFSFMFADFYLKEQKLYISSFKRILLILIIIISFFLVVATASKKGIVLLVMYLSYKIFSLKIKTLFSKNIIIVGLIAVLSIQFIEINIFTDSFFATLQRVDAFLTQFNSTTNIGGSTSERIYFIKEGLKGFLQSPILGNGFKSFEAKYDHYAHNNFIELLYCGGLLALLIYVSIYFKLLAGIRKQRKELKTLVIFSILALLAIDIAAVTYLMKIMQYYLCTLFILINIPCEISLRDNG